MNPFLTTELDPFAKVGKYNESISLTEDDKKNKVRVYCQEPYAQMLYDMMSGRESSGVQKITSKDLTEGEVYKVRPKTLYTDDKTLLVEEINSGVSICIPLKEYSKPLEDLVSGNIKDFYVTLYKVTKSGEYFGSEKKALSVTYKQELFDHLNNSTWFDVKIKRLIKGGYLAIYQNEVECFIPGSHAAANVVHNFNDMLGKTLTVMVDNYDAANDLFILSYKKYIAKSMPTMISELSFDVPYAGVLTNSPYDFGVFVEIDGYYTGLIHKSEFQNYDEIRKTLRAGDKIQVYVKDVTQKGDQYRIVLTLDQSQVSTEKMQWQTLRNRTENQSFKYTVNENKNSISIEIDGEKFDVSLKRQDLKDNLNRYPLVKVFKVDPIKKSLKFEFVEA